MLPTKWYHRRERNCPFSLPLREEDKLPAVGSPGGLCFTSFSHRPISVFIDSFHLLQMDRQMVPSRSLRG